MELLVSLHLPDEPAGIDLVLECDSDAGATRAAWATVRAPSGPGEPREAEPGPALA